MTAEIGLFSLILALVCACLGAIVPTVGLIKNNKEWIAATDIYVPAQFLFVALAYLCLTFAFLKDDFSLIYVMSNSSLALPWFYKLCAVWGGHEGSMLLWVAILSFWMLLVCYGSASLDKALRTRVLVVLSLLSVGFLLFLLMTSNPFLRQFTHLETEGRDLNPLLQDPGFLFHPPVLYMGYVGFSVAFAFAIATLWSGRFESSWAKWTRPWTLAAWCFLTAGITLGSWWAYRELGWGGWWFWDPVENASFMPWLCATALIHSLAVTEKRRLFQIWTLLLAITAFSLSLIGTFLVRSGVLTSVHAFAVDPERGLYILVFLFLVIGGSLLLFSIRAHKLQATEGVTFVSRESALLMNNLFLMVAMLSILTGTLYPLIIDGLGLGKLSVGAPYFNTVFVPLMVFIALLMGIGMNLCWQKDSVKRLSMAMNWVALLSLLIPSAIIYFTGNSWNINVLLGLVLSNWIMFSTCKAIKDKTRQAGAFRKISRPFWGMVLAHIGIAVSITGVAVSTGYGLQQDIQMAPESKTILAGYTIAFVKEEALHGPNYSGAQAIFEIQKPGSDTVSRIYPQKRIYTVGGMPMTDAAIDISPFRDIYIALGEPLSERSWSVRIYYKPLVRWIWGGGFLMLAGGFFALADPRYYMKKKAKVPLASIVGNKI